MQHLHLRIENHQLSREVEPCAQVRVGASAPLVREVEETRLLERGAGDHRVSRREDVARAKNSKGLGQGSRSVFERHAAGHLVAEAAQTWRCRSTMSGGDLVVIVEQQQEVAARGLEAEVARRTLPCLVELKHAERQDPGNARAGPSGAGRGSLVDDDDLDRKNRLVTELSEELLQIGVSVDRGDQNGHLRGGRRGSAATGAHVQGLGDGGAGAASSRRGAAGEPSRVESRPEGPIATGSSGARSARSGSRRSASRLRAEDRRPLSTGAPEEETGRWRISAPREIQR